MGEIVMAAKVSHVPSIWMSETIEEFRGIRDNAINGLREIGARARAAGVETFVIFDTHWIVNQGFHINANSDLSGNFTSHELPHMLSGMDYAYRGDPRLAERIAVIANERDLRSIAHKDPGLGLEYGTLIPMRHMNADAFANVVPIAVNQFASIDEGRRFGAAVADAVGRSERKVGIIASGSLSHNFAPNAISPDYLNKVNGEFNRQVDARVLQMWENREYAEFLAMLPEYAQKCHGECGMIDTAHLFGVLGWDAYNGRSAVIGHYFGSSGTGQVNVVFDV